MWQRVSIIFIVRDLPLSIVISQPITYLLTSSFVAKISDLGVSRMADTFNYQKLSVAPGNSVVMPPEALKDNPVYDYKLDVFSYGCLILHVFTHEWPKPSDKYVHSTDFFQKGTFILVNEWDRRAKYTAIISNDNPFYLFAKSCLENDPKKRPTMSNAITCAQGAVSSLHPLKNQFEMIKENNALRKQVAKQVQDIRVLEEKNKTQTNTYLLEEVMEQTQSYTQRLEQEKKEAQDNVNQLQQEKEKAQTDARVSRERMDQALLYAHTLQQEKEEIQDNTYLLEGKIKQTQRYARRLEQEKEKAQNDISVLARISDKEKNRLQVLLSELKKQKTSLLRQVTDLEERLNRVQTKLYTSLKLSFLAIIIILILQYSFLRLL